MMMLRIAGVNMPPQLMRGPEEPGYRGREPILVSVSAARPVVKAWKGIRAHPLGLGYLYSVEEFACLGNASRV